MSTRLHTSPTISLAVCAVAALFLAVSCHESSSSPTSPGSGATVMGTVIRGSGTLGATTQGTGIGLPQVTVRVVQTGRSTQTDASGDFMLMDVPVGNVEFAFSRADINARGRVPVAPGSNAVTVAVTGSTAVVVPRGHAGEEIEGLVSAVDPGAGTLTVLDQRLGAVVVKTGATTIVRHGQTAMTLSQLQIGMRVHVKALLQQDNTYLATEIVLQSQNPGGERGVTGSVTSIDAGAKTFVVQSTGASVITRTDTSTTFRRRGNAASFSDVTVGAIVEVTGILQADGSILARKVTIE
jgi:Domain of unknown function (DUF5666)